MLLVTVTVHSPTDTCTFNVPVDDTPEHAFRVALEQLSSAGLVPRGSRLEFGPLETCPDTEDPARPHAFPLHPAPAEPVAPAELAPGAGGLYLTTVEVRRGQSDITTLHVPSGRHLNLAMIAEHTEGAESVQVIAVEALPEHEDPARPWLFHPDDALPLSAVAELERLGWAEAVEREAERSEDAARVDAAVWAGREAEPETREMTPEEVASFEAEREIGDDGSDGNEDAVGSVGELASEPEAAEPDIAVEKADAAERRRRR